MTVTRMVLLTFGAIFAAFGLMAFTLNVIVPALR